VTERIRVLRIIARLNVGGPAIHAAILTERLAPARYESTLAAGAVEPTEGDYLALQGRTLPRLVPVRGLGREIRGAQDLAALAALVRLVRRLRPHIVHTHTAKAGTLGRLAAWLCRVPVVVHTYHGHVLRGYFSPAKTRAFVAIERALSRVTDALVAVSPRVRAELLELGIGRADRFEVVPLGLDLEPFASADRRRGELRHELGLEAGTPLAGIVARLVPIKAHEVLLDAARRLGGRPVPPRVVIAGDGERRAELEAMAATDGLRGRVHFLGWRADLPRIYADLDVVVLCSRNEGSPVALIEAMAAGRPVVATRVGGVPDVVIDGESGLLVPEDDAPALAQAIARVLDDRELARRLGAAGRQRVVERFGAERLVRDIDALYARLLTEKRVRA
jgi:glycosyltransferase involved in cell wall biosynthesis